jgi:hypothetical protein
VPNRFAESRREAPGHRLVAIQLAEHEPRRLTLHLVAQGLLLLQNPLRRGAYRAVIEVGDVWVEEPVLQHRAAECGHL